jgi:SAM-dependent methyltransferase
MTTLPPEQAPSSGSGPREIHHYRQVAESFGADAQRYDRARPSYPAALVDRVVAASPGREVLDVGCGTGISARLFQAAGCRVLGVDPDARMADLARQRGLDVEVARFEGWDPAGREFDAVIAAQAWHWVDPVVGAAKAAQALRAGGRLAVFWNSFRPPAGLGEAFAAVFRRVLPDSPLPLGRLPGPDGYSALASKAADGMRQAGAFGHPEEWRFDWERPCTRDEWLDQLPTFGGSTQLGSAKLQDLRTGIGDAIDAVGGSFTMGYTVVVSTAARNGGLS